VAPEVIVVVLSLEQYFVLGGLKTVHKSVSQTHILVSKKRWFTIVWHHVSALSSDYYVRVSCCSCISICWAGKR